MFSRGSKKYQKILAYTIILSMQLNTFAYAASVVTPDKTNGRNPGVSQAANGVQVVDIRTPNNKGLSHNQYTNLQVDKEGLIFNNSGNISNTQLAGYINGNKYLVGNTGAKIILNEVTGKLPTSLNGYMEIAGNKADLVIANPNGIVGNNFGYINTGRAVLTTGTPIVGAEGDLRGFNVSQGSVTIEGLGLDAKTTSSTEIYARAAKVNAGIWAQDLKITTGSNKIDYATGDVAEVTSDEDKGVSLDVAALGGMYAGKIKLVGTAKGLGVNMEGNISALDTDVIVNQNGDVINKAKFEAKNNVSIDAKGNVSNTATGNISAGNKAEVRAQGDITNAGSIYGAVNTDVNSAANVSNTGLINGGDTIVTAGQNIDNTSTGRIYGDNVKIKAATLNNIAGTSAPVIAARQDMTIEADTVNNKEHAVLTAERDMTIKAGTVNNNSATIEAGHNMDITANAVNNTNEHFATEVQVVKEEDIVELQGDGEVSRYRVGDTQYTIDPEAGKYSHKARPDLDVYIFDDESDHLHTPTGDYDEWSKYVYHRTTKEDVIISTDPGKITAGNNLIFTGGTVTNDKSQIIAGSTITANVSALNNIEGTGKQYVEDKGDAHSYWRHHESGNDSTGHKRTDYNPPTVVTDIVVPASTYKNNTTPAGSGITAGNGSYSSLFTNAPDATAHYYVETDRAYTNKKQWLSSDYFFTQMGYDADKVAKRLRDGYYEQKLVRDQVMNLTGKRFTGTYTSDEAEYQGLLDNAVAFAKNNSLTVGVAPTDEQLKNLTEAIVWMVEESVVLPDGQIVKALVPKVYLPETTKDNYSTLGSAVIGAENININAVNDVLNNGSIVAGDKTNISATNINNYGGTIKGSDVIVNAMNNVNNIGGAFIADTSMDIKAGNNINMVTTTSHAENANGSRTSINQVAGVYVTGENGSLNMQAGNDVNLKAADVAVTGENSKANIKAGNDVNLTTVKAGSSNDIIFDKKNYRHDTSSKDVGTSIQTTGSLSMSAGKDVNATAAYVSTGKELEVKAGNSINVQAGHDYETVDEHHVHKGRSGGGNKQTYTTDNQLKGDYAVGSTFSGNTVSMEAGKDVNVTGSNVVGTEDVNLKAGNDVNIQAADETQDEKHFYKLEESGIFSSGFGFTIGTQTTKETNNAQNTMKSGSTVGSIKGNVNITAGNNAKVEASDIIAGQDINVTAKNVDITSANEQYNSQYKYEYEMSGLTVSISGGIVGRAMQVVSSIERARQVSDSRLSALYGVKAAQDAKDVVRNKIVPDFDSIEKAGIEAGKTDDAIKADKVAAQEKADKDNAKNKAFNINVGWGSSSSSETSNSISIVAKSSNLKAGGNVNIKATEKDINIHGSNVSGEDVDLTAAKDVNITAAENVNKTDTENKSSSYGFGVTFSTAGGVGAYASASTAKEKINENGITYTPSTVAANNKLAINSGKDMNIIGSQVSGDRVEVEIGGNLNIESLQETQTYKEKSSSAGISLSTSGVSGSASSGKMNSDYASVTNQAGIYAGNKGFDITVKGNTDLKGAVIDSTATADKNSLTTGTITFSDIENKAEYSTSGFGFSYDGAATKDSQSKLGDKGFIPNIPMSSGDDKSSTTKSGVAAGTITITGKQQQDISTLNRNTADTLNKLDQIFDKDTIQEKQEMGALFAELAYNQIHTIAEKNGW